MKSISLLILLCASIAHAAEPKPNVLFIAIDDFRPELGCYGSPQVKTPHIDQLASVGMRFDRAYCQVPICMGSRASMLTGILPTAKRFVGNCRVEVDVPDAATLPETFRSSRPLPLRHHLLRLGRKWWSPQPPSRADTLQQTALLPFRSVTGFSGK